MACGKKWRQNTSMFLSKIGHGSPYRLWGKGSARMVYGSRIGKVKKIEISTKKSKRKIYEYEISNITFKLIKEKKNEINKNVKDKWIKQKNSELIALVLGAQHPVI
jgi:hypothetical protein